MWFSAAVTEIFVFMQMLFMIKTDTSQLYLNMWGWGEALQIIIENKGISNFYVFGKPFLIVWYSPYERGRPVLSVEYAS